MTNTSRESRKDRLTAEATAFDCYAELTAACRDGYVPTLRTRGGRGAAEASRDAAVRELRTALVLDGFEVWPG